MLASSDVRAVAGERCQCTAVAPCMGVSVALARKEARNRVWRLAPPCMQAAVIQQDATQDEGAPRRSGRRPGLVDCWSKASRVPRRGHTIGRAWSGKEYLRTVALSAFAKLSRTPGAQLGVTLSILRRPRLAVWRLGCGWTDSAIHAHVRSWPLLGETRVLGCFLSRSKR